MTDRRRVPPGPAPLSAPSGTVRNSRRAPRPPHAVTTTAVALVLFIVAMTFLGWQMRNGQDPALGAGSPVATAPPQPRRVLIRRIQRKVIVTTIKPAPIEATVTAVGAPVSSGGAVAQSYSAPVQQTYSAPVQQTYSAPAAPAPAPATSSSGG